MSDEQLEAALDAAYPRTGIGFTFGGRGHYDVSDRMALGVDLGLFVWDGDLERVEGADVDLDVDGTDLWFGVFGNYAVSERVLLGLAWRSFVLDGARALVWWRDRLYLFRPYQQVFLFLILLPLAKFLLYCCPAKVDFL